MEGGGARARESGERCHGRGGNSFTWRIGTIRIGATRQLVVLSSNNDQRRLKLKSGAGRGGVAHATIAALRVLDIKRGRKARLPALSAASARRPTGDRILFDVSSLSPVHGFHRLNPDTRPMIRDNQREISSRANYRVGG